MHARSEDPAPIKMKKFVWDTSAILNIKEPNANGYSPGHSLFKDLSDGWIPGPYQNIFPAIAAFEVDASVSRKLREGKKILRHFYIVNENAIIYPIDDALIERCADIMASPGFAQLRGADLIFACIAFLEDAFLVTMDRGFSAVASRVKVIDLNDSLDTARYRRLFDL
jgi:predicted nucleic acid-binding protein